MCLTSSKNTIRGVGKSEDSHEVGLSRSFSRRGTVEVAVGGAKKRFSALPGNGVEKRIMAHVVSGVPQGRNVTPWLI